jgi:amino acid permease
MIYLTKNEILTSLWFITLIVIIPLFLISLIKNMSGFKYISYLSVLIVLIFIIFLIVTFHHQMNIEQRRGDYNLFKFNISMLRVLGTLGKFFFKF